MAKKRSKKFVTITNREIYNKICKMHDDILKQNGRIKLNTWSMRVIMIIITVLLSKVFINW